MIIGNRKDFARYSCLSSAFGAAFRFLESLPENCENENIRENGVRGGTILNARGVANQEAAAFFGITLHTEKEILMMVVEKDIRDNVLNAIYKEMGMSKKAKGIAFSLPVSDVAGLVKEPEHVEAVE